MYKGLVSPSAFETPKTTGPFPAIQSLSDAKWDADGSGINHGEKNGVRGNNNIFTTCDAKIGGLHCVGISGVVQKNR